MACELPELVECRQLAAGAGALSGSLTAARLARIDDPYRLAGDTYVELRCRSRDGGAYQIEGLIEAPLEVRCQRCLEWMAWPLKVTLGLVAFSKAPPSQDHDEEDSVELVDGILPLREVVEDEVLLSCPFAPVHAPADCSAGENVLAAEVSSDRRQPFADLANLLKSREPE